MLGFITLPAAASRHSLRTLRTAGVSIALAAVTIIATAGTVLAWDAASFSPSDEQLLFSLTNQDRASGGLNALVNDSYLHKEAEWRAKDMGDRGYFSHQIPPNNSTVFNYMQSDGYCFKVAGENIGEGSYGDDVSTSRIEAAFMGSQPHRANILGTWARLGVGAYKAANGNKYYDVLFSIPCSVTVPTPAPVTTPAPTNGQTTAPTLKPTPMPTLKPTPMPTPMPTAQATIVPTRTPDGIPASTAGATPTASDTPTAEPSPTLTPDFPTVAPPVAPTVVASSEPTLRLPFIASIAGQTLSLRVREKPVSQSPIDWLLHALFGGLFGW